MSLGTTQALCASSCSTDIITDKPQKELFFSYAQSNLEITLTTLILDLPPLPTGLLGTGLDLVPHALGEEEHVVDLLGLGILQSYDSLHSCDVTPLTKFDEMKKP